MGTKDTDEVEMCHLELYQTGCGYFIHKLLELGL